MASVLIDEVCAQFQRFWLNDPVLQAMERGDILWGDIPFTKEETLFHNEWALKNATHIEVEIGATAPSTPLERPETPVFIPFDEESALWQPVAKPKPTRREPMMSPAQSAVPVGIKTLIARNLPRDITVETLRATFEMYGPVKDVYIPRNMERTSPLYGTVKGFALIKFLKPTDSATAFTQLFGKLTFGSNNVSIEFAKEDR
jgi:hypothetical protein